MKFQKFIPILLILVLMATLYFLGITDYLSFEVLKEKREQILDFLALHPVLSPLIFILSYILSTALSLPGGAILSILGGFLFPFPFGFLYSLFGATVGAMLIFASAKTALGELLKKKVAPFFGKLEKGFNENAVSYLLFLRLSFVFPFWLINIAPAFFRVPFWTFSWTTCIGIIPGTFVYTQAGTGLGSILDANEQLTISGIFTWEIRVALIVIALFSLIPILVKKLRKRKQNR